MKRVDVALEKVSREILEQLPKGAFLTVRYGNRLNTMTIGWGAFGVIWTAPVFIVAVRYSRHTFKLIERAADFTVSLPRPGEYRKELGYCGSHSGKDVDKFAECGFSSYDALKTETPVLRIPGIHLECRTLLRGPMQPDLMHPDLMEFYPKEDFHTFYFGRVEACYRLTSAE